ncbi:hypothetical protein C8T65DRAFT_639532 [Cerioporus squamosus]|nr:hypothetical protein C8T65DRAFT_639532 [Cerioporus squamosus]
MRMSCRRRASYACPPPPTLRFQLLPHLRRTWRALFSFPVSQLIARRRVRLGPSR